MISVVVRDLPYLKLLHPICTELSNMGIPYIIHHMSCPRGEKAYNDVSVVNIKKAAPDLMMKAKKVKLFSTNDELIGQLKHDSITKVISVEISLWAKKIIPFFKNNNIKTYSVLYLTDSLWTNSTTNIDKVYYTTDHLMKSYHLFSGQSHDKDRDRAIGSPLFDSIESKPSDGEDVLVLLPNMRKEHVIDVFATTDRFVQIIDKISCSGNIIFKSRKKQWLPNEIKHYADKIVFDDAKMYPTTISKLLKQTSYTVMFGSSGIYECVYGGNYVINVPMPLKRWNWNKAKMKGYFSTTEESLYNFDGVVESIPMDKFLTSKFRFMPKRIDPGRMKRWIDRYIKPVDDSARKIAEDVVNE